MIKGLGRNGFRTWTAFGVGLLVIYSLLSLPFNSIHTRAQERTSEKKGTYVERPNDSNPADSFAIPDVQIPRTVTSENPTKPNRPDAITIGGSDIEPNGTTATASPITTPARILGNLNPNGDIDFYSFSGTAGDRFYGAIMTSGSAGNSADSQMTLIASDGTTTIEFDDDNGSFGTLSSSIAGATLPTTGTYYVKVNDFTAGTTSQRGYELYVKLQSGSPTAEVEANDTPATANVLPGSGWVSGARNPAAATEQDWYSMNLNAGDTVFLSLDLDPERDGTTWNGRLGIALFGDSSNQILPADDAGTGDVSPVPNRPSEAMFMTVKSAGTYFAFVDSATPTTGGPTSTYHLSVAVYPKAVEGVNCTTYTSTNVPQTIGPNAGLVSSTITVPGNPRIADLDVSINLNHTLMQDLDVHLRSPAGNDNGLFTDIGASAIGGQAQMDTTFDDEAGLIPAYTALKGLQLKPENTATVGTASTSGAYRLSWFDGENAGGTWTLDIRDDTDGNGGTLNGWSMTICEEPPPPACPVGFTRTTVFSSDFESGAAGFTHSGTQDEWELGLPATVATTTANPVAPFSTCNSGSNCWKTDLDNTYNASSTQDLLSPNINLAGLSAPVIVTWAQRHQVEIANFDHFSVDFQQVGGATPVNLYTWLDPTMISASSGTGNPQANIGGSAGWGVFSRRADSLAGLNTEFKVHLDSDSSVQFGGVAIDDVSVSACRALSADLSITKTDGVASVTAGGSTTYTITASNAGPDAVTGATVADTFPAALTVTGWTCIGAGGATCTAAGAGNINDTSVNIPAGGSVTYTAMANVSGGATGTISNTATVSSSATDPNPANNSATDIDTVQAAACETTTTIPGTGVGAIPDGLSLNTPAYGAPLTISFPVTGLTGTLTKVSADVTLTHTFVGDVDMVLAAPGGSPNIVLVSRIGATTAAGFGDSSNYGGMYNFTDTAAGTNIWTLATGVCDTNCAVTPDSYRSTAGGGAGQTNPPPFTNITATFIAMTNPQINNTWTLAIRDATQSDTGSVTAANLTLRTNRCITASTVSVSGRAVTAEGRGVRSARVTITDENGVSRTVSTGDLGRFQFDDVVPGHTYVVSVGSRRYTFSPQVVQINDNIADLNFVAGN